MSSSRPLPRRRSRIHQPAAAAATLVAVLGLGLGVAVHEVVTDPTSTSAATSTDLAQGPGRSLPAGAPDATPDQAPPRGSLGLEDGKLPDDTTAFADAPGVSRLDPALLSALRRAATAAARDGVKVRITSGWRSPAYQQHLLDEAVAEHGSEAEARRWVATPETSEHVAGRAVDLGPKAASSWMERNGARFGLCRTYRNERWHFELRPAAVTRGCPRMYADPTEDPRLRS